VLLECTATTEMHFDGGTHWRKLLYGWRREGLVECTDSLTHAPSLQSRSIRDLRDRGLQLFRHAKDDPLECWPVFGEACQALVSSIRVADGMLMDRWQQIGGARRPLVTKSTRHPGRAWQSSQRGDSDWKPLTFAAMYEGMRAPSWRVSSAWRFLRRRDIWIMIARFLAPDTASDLEQMISLICKCTKRHAALRQQMQHDLVMSRAYYYLCATHHDTAHREKQDILECALRASFRRCSPSARTDLPLRQMTHKTACLPSMNILPSARVVLLRQDALSWQCIARNLPQRPSAKLLELCNDSIR